MGKLIADAQRLLNILQVLNVHEGCKRLMATQACGLLCTSTLLFVKLHADLRRPLEYMKEFSKRKIQQRKNDGDRMQHGEKAIVQSMQQVRGCGEKKASDRNGKQHQQRHHVLGKLLDGDCPSIAGATEKCKSHPGQYHDGRDI